MVMQYNNFKKGDEKMPGTKLGGQKARETNYKKYGKDFFCIIGSKGGQAGHTGGFAACPELAKIAGAKGGRISRRTGVTTGQSKEKEYIWKGGPDAKLVFKKEETN